MINSTGVKFTVGEQETGTPYIQMWVDGKVLGMPNEPAVLEVKPGSSMQEVEAIKNYLNSNIVSFSLYPAGLGGSAKK
ncbi:hypothetical protein V2J66_07340 [Pseudomonas alliivorans]|uniref:hypothetical protein n=1 Tax=Pseudomonas fragariae (ex Marin et al. 2024) TaxID=3080056 RepID=UPI002EB966E6|nr:hypothetical protein [Pseudomonas alliivorans]MEE5126118.1 hypothetical protein [Pseudomonas alliivorans]